MKKRNRFRKIKTFFNLIRGKKCVNHKFNFEIHLTDACNLNCKGCFHFSPLANKNSNYPLDEFKNDINRIAELFNNHFGWIHLLGGEPLLNDNIKEYLIYAGETIKGGKISLLTNGILLNKMDDEFFKICKKYSITISVTKYPIQLDYNEIEKLITSHGCRCEFFGDKRKDTSFMTASLNLKSSMPYKNNFLRCKFSNACVTLNHGKLYYCSIPAYIYLFNAYYKKNLVTNMDEIDIYNHDKKEILNFLRTPHQFCKYCDIRYRQEHKMPWNISKKEINEWVRN